MRKSFCDVENCAEFATVEVDGRLRLNVGKLPPQFIAVEFKLCPAHEIDHDNSYEEPRLRATKKTPTHKRGRKRTP